MTSPDQQHRNLETIQDGRNATIVAGVVRPYIDERIYLLMHNMAGMYRSKQLNHDILVGTAAQMSCLLDMLSDLDSKARQGDIAANKEIGRAKTQNY